MQLANKKNKGKVKNSPYFLGIKVLTIKQPLEKMKQKLQNTELSNNKSIICQNLCGAAKT